MQRKVWIPTKDSQSWELADIVLESATSTAATAASLTASTAATAAADEASITVESASQGRMTLPRSVTHRCDVTHFEDHEDLCEMNHLHEAPLLHCLRSRFAQGKIYTTTGDVLLSVNPYKKIPGLYDSVLSYLDLPEEQDDSDSSAAAPHVFKVANSALQELLYGKRSSSSLTPAASRNQSIVVSGESGAGKTEASKQVMSFLLEADQEMYLIRNNNNRSSSDSYAQQRQVAEDIRKVLLQSNVIFEAFGNAKTLRNDNSSRFGKYIKLQYSAENRIVSAYTETFLLEKSRLRAVGDGERNYHVFYQFLRNYHNASINTCNSSSNNNSIINNNKTLASLREELQLLPAEEFKILTDGAGTAAASCEDAHFQLLLDCLVNAGCSSEEVQQLLTLLACILHMGNFTTQSAAAAAAEAAALQQRDSISGFTEDAAADSGGRVLLQSPSLPLPQLTRLLGVSAAMFESGILTQRVQVATRRSITVKNLSEVEVMNNISALSKWIYSSLFSWLLKKVNFAHCSVNSDPAAVAENFIGILDIFGFEILQNNSFEQLCINFTNERLQQQFNEFVFDREQDVYRAEGLDWATVSYRDNQHVIDLIAKKPTGLLVLLEAQGMLNRGGDKDEAALIAAFNQTHGNSSSSGGLGSRGSSKLTSSSSSSTASSTTTAAAATTAVKVPSDAYEKSRFSSDSKFVVRHFAGDVEYSVAGFMEKNNDSLQDDLMALMLTSTNEFVQNAIVAVGLDKPCIPGQAGFIGEISTSKIAAGRTVLSTTSTAAAVAAASQYDKAKKSGKRGSLLVTAAPDNSSNTISSNNSSSKNNSASSTGASGKKMASTVTVSYQFRHQLELLLLTLRATSPHYIKCLKPNAIKSSAVADFDDRMLLEQLRYSGALEVVRIRQDGFPICLSFLRFYEVFHALSFKRSWEPLDSCSEQQAKHYAQTLCCEQLQEGPQFQIGKSKVFMRSESYELLHQAVITFLSSKVTRFQTYWRKHAAKGRYRVVMRGVLQLQCRLRARTARVAVRALLLARRQQQMEAAAALQRQREAEEAAMILQQLQEEEQRQQQLAAVAEQQRLRAEAEQRELEQRQQELQQQQQLFAQYEARIQQLHQCCRSGDVAAVQQLLTAHPEDYAVTDWTQFNRSALQSAILSGSVPLIQYLRPQPFELDFTDQRGNAAVHYAVMLLMQPVPSTIDAAATDATDDVGSENPALDMLRHLEFILDTSNNSNSSGLEKAMQQLHVRPIAAGAALLPSPPQHLSLSAPQSPQSTFSTTTPAAAFATMGDLDAELLAAAAAAGGNSPIAGGRGAGNGRESVIVKAVLADRGAVVPGAAAGRAIKAGWMSKRGESQTWRKRWVVLTNDSLMYFRSERDKLPRDTLSLSKRNNIHIERCSDRLTGIDIFCSEQSVKKGRGRISLMAELEEDTQDWINLLKAAAGVECEPLRASAAAAGAVRTVSPVLSEEFLKLTNRKYDTALHLLCQQLTATAADAAAAADGTTAAAVVAPTSASLIMNELRAVFLAAWLLNRGCKVVALNGAGQTALAAAAGCSSLQLLLQRYTTMYEQRADVGGSRSSSVPTAAATTTNERLVERCYLPAPLRLRSFHYLMIEVQQQTISDPECMLATDSLQFYSLVVSAFNGNHLPVEKLQVSPHPLLLPQPQQQQQQQPQQLLWPGAFHLQVPMDNLEDGSYIVFELRRLQPQQAAVDYAATATATTAAAVTRSSLRTQHGFVSSFSSSLSTAATAAVHAAATAGTTSATAASAVVNTSAASASTASDPGGECCGWLVLQIDKRVINTAVATLQLLKAPLPAAASIADVATTTAATAAAVHSQLLMEITILRRVGHEMY